MAAAELEVNHIALSGGNAVWAVGEARSNGDFVGLGKGENGKRADSECFVHGADCENERVFGSE